ncbi:MAG TPA: rhodanese-like domain-containing protein [Thermoanaerobaculia bacterium]|nr:rhodanese-like domain-containing protein [Thermoanaerobaculia bacterium]
MNTVILDARPRAAYEAGHRQGAIHADPETKLASPRDPARGGRHPLPPIDQWRRQVAEWGITPETHVLVYDDQNGANAAARAWWMLNAIGIHDVEVENVGRASARPSSQNAWGLPTVDMSFVDAHRNDPGWRVLDVRSRERFRGDTEPIDPIAGHIPGAVNLAYTENLNKSPEQLRTMYGELLGDVPPERLIVHCGSGVTACHTLLALEMAGLSGASLYVGSWGEWCRNDMPIGKVRE